MTGNCENLGDIFRGHAAGSALAVIDLYDPMNPRKITYRALDGGCDAVAGGLRAVGLGPGDRVGILALNRVEYIEVLFGAMRAGCVPVMINAKLPAEMVRFIVDDCGARVLFADHEYRSLCPEGVRVIEFGADYADFLRADRAPSFVPGPHDIAEQPYTSGSTGRPKGVLLSHAGQCWMTRALVESRDLSATSRGIISAPLYHKNALLAVKSALAAGGATVLLARFDAAHYIQAIGRYGLTMLTGVPTMYALVLQQAELLAETDISTVRVLSMGSAPASDALLDDLAQVFPDAAINLNYGITEGGPVMFSWKHPDGLKKPRTTVGAPLPGTELRLEGRPDVGSDAGPDAGPDADQGVLHVRNPGVMEGYHNLERDTARILKDGWLDTGDILKRDAEGWYYFVGRVDDMFVCGGENIYPGVIEAMLERHPGILQACVVPAPDALKAHVPYAFVVPRAGAALDENAVKRYALDHGPAFAHPRRVIFTDALPLAGTNKIDREALGLKAAETAGGGVALRK